MNEDGVPESYIKIGQHGIHSARWRRAIHKPDSDVGACLGILIRIELPADFGCRKMKLMKHIYSATFLFISAFMLARAFTLQAAQTLIEPLFRMLDLNVGETGQVILANGQAVSVKLIDLKEQRCDMRGAVRRAELGVEVAGQRAQLVAATYNLPKTVGSAQIDCPITRGYIERSSEDNVWALDKDARLRLWPAGSPWIQPGTFGYPLNQRWFASDTQMANDPCYADGGDKPGLKSIYYHYGLDFGGAEGLADVLAATDGTFVCRGNERMPGLEYPPQVKPRYDVLYIRDDRGWYYRYSHLMAFEPSAKLGQRVKMGTKIGTLGKEGGSGGWSHLHVDITMLQPSGRYGITDGYAFIHQAYRERHNTKLMAVARPHAVAWCGEPVTLDATRSWHADGPEHLKSFTWKFSDGSAATGPTNFRRYEQPGHYTEVLKVMDDQGHSAWDIAVVEVFNRQAPLPVPAIHAVYWPTLGINPGDTVNFKARTFNVRPDEGEEEWDFGDGAATQRTRSDGNESQHAPNGYAIVAHHFAKPGNYVVRVQRANQRGETATARLLVQVGGN